MSSIVTKVQQELYDAVQDYIKKNPGSSEHKALVALGRKTSASTYSQAKLNIKGASPKRKYKKRQSMITIIPETTVKTNHLVAFVGDAESVVKSVRSLLGDS